MLILYVDDIIILTADKSITEKTMAGLKDEYGCPDLGRPEMILNINVDYDKSGGATLHQTDQIDNFMARMDVEKPTRHYKTPLQPGIQFTKRPKSEPQKPEKIIKWYMSVIGSVIYFSVWCRPDLVFAINKLSRYMQDPSRKPNLQKNFHQKSHQKLIKKLNCSWKMPCTHYSAGYQGCWHPLIKKSRM